MQNIKNKESESSKGTRGGERRVSSRKERASVDDGTMGRKRKKGRGEGKKRTRQKEKYEGDIQKKQVDREISKQERRIGE